MKFAYAFSQDGQICYEAHSGYKVVPFDSFGINYPGCVVVVFNELQHQKVSKEFLMLGDDGIVKVKPGWVKPAEQLSPFEELKVLLNDIKTKLNVVDGKITSK